MTTIQSHKKVHSQMSRMNQTEITIAGQEQDLPQDQCRICLSSQCDDNNRLLNPCECNGSLRFVHQKCLREWLHSKVSNALKNQQIDNLKSVQCELCKKQIEVSLNIYRKCSSRQKLCENIEERTAIFIFCAIGMLLSFGLLIFSMVQLILDSNREIFNTERIRLYIIIVSIIANALLFAFFTSHTSQFMLERAVDLQLKKA